MQIKIPDWLETFGWNAREEKLRGGNGLTPKRDGWYKSVAGKTRYVCKPCPIPEAITALEVRLRKWTGKGKTTHHIPVNEATLTLESLVEMFLSEMFDRYRTKSPKPLSRQTYDDYVNTLDTFVEIVGPARVVTRMGPDDFSRYVREHLATRAASTRRRLIQYVDRLFNWAGPGKRSKNLIPFVVRGPDWVKPSDEEIATDAADSDKAYTVQQTVRAFDAVKDNPLLNAAAHLGLACAMGPKDVGTLPEHTVNLDAAEIRFPRGKTGIHRLCPLPHESVKALRDYLTFRAKFKSIRPEAVGLFFRTREGMPYARHWKSDGQDAGRKDNLMSRQWKDATGLPFSGLRSTFATLADDWADQRAVDVVMGHKVGKVGRHIRRHYAKKFNADRARQLVDHVWRLAFLSEVPATPSPARAAKARVRKRKAVPADSRATARKRRG